MALVTYIEPGGREVKVEATTGESLMRAAVRNGVNGIVAQCGGGASCGTCHVFVESTTEHLTAMHAVEDELLYCTAEPRQDESRLSCQLQCVAELDGLRLRIPNRQI